MKINEIIVEGKTFVLKEAGMAHAEDLVFFEGSAGALRALNSIVDLTKNKDETLSIKWDGSPRMVAGRNDKGQFIMTDGAGWGAKSYNGHYTSAKAFVDQKRSKGTDEGYLSRVASLWPIMESAFPPNYRGFVNGDVMWFPGEIKDNGRRYVFTPNTVTYEVDKASDLGKRVGQGKAGFAVHGFFASETDQTPTPLKNTAGLNMNGSLCVLGPEIKNEATLQKDKVRPKQITQFIKKNAKAIDAMLDAGTLAELKMTSFPQLLYTFVNAQTKTRDLSMLAEKFLPWVATNPKLSKVMAQKVSEYVRENQVGLKAIFGVFDAITDLKLDVIRQLDSHEGSVIAHIAGARGGEGYVISHPEGPIKTVNRLGFSATNFAGNE